MRITLRAKLLLIVGATALWMLLSIVVNGISSVGQKRDLSDLESRIVPRLALAPQLNSAFSQLRQEMQNAVAAQDSRALDATVGTKDGMMRLIVSAGNAISPDSATDLRNAVEQYYVAALGVSQRLVNGDTDETLGPKIEDMQAKQVAVTDRITRATALGNNEVAAAFLAVRAANQRDSIYHLSLGIAGLTLVLLLSLWASRGILRSVSEMSSGFTRFGTGSFGDPIVVSGNDELSDMAAEANKMAINLDRLNEERNNTDWLKESRVGLSDQLRGELQPSEVTRRALHFLASRVGAVVGTFHVIGNEGEFDLSAQFALASDALGSAAQPPKRFKLAEGLCGQAAMGRDIVILNEPPRGYLKLRSSLGESDPRAIVFIPLTHLDQSVGLIELALLEPCTEKIREFLASIQEGLVITLMASQSRAALRDLLAQARSQAERLTAQEEELRANNQELESQQDVLRTANDELDAQRRVLSEKNDELEAARVDLQLKAEELTRVSSYKSQFLSNMSHELRTPLNSMLILSHLLSENEGKNLSAKQVEHAKTIHSAGQDLLTLINQVLDLAKIEAGRQEIHVQTVNLASIASYARRVFEPLASEKGLKLRLEVTPDVPPAIETDRHRLERILTNLLGNAIKFTEQGEVALRIHRPEPNIAFERDGLLAGQCVAFSVSDTGIGIAPEDAQRVFAPFEQVTGANAGHGGTGLGLAISRESAGLLGGELRLSSTPGQGSTFTCFIPEKAPAAVQRSAIAAANALSTAHGGEDLSPLHLLVIEDDAVVAEQLLDIIRDRGLSVAVARTGEEGLILARTRHPRGIVLDVKLPDIDGWTVMQRLHADPATSSIPVHFISAIDAPQRGFALGAIGYLTKPVSRDELVGMVRVLVPSSEQERPRILVVEDNASEGASVVALLQNQPVDLLHVGSAEEALTALQLRDFGCMIVDLGLPDMDGLGLLETLRARTHIRYPRVIVHTGRALTKKETRELEAYAEAIILKDGHSAERLLGEVRLFVKHVKEGLGPAVVKALGTASDLSLNGVTLLLAEDDMRTVYAISALLRGRGAEVIVAETGREALDLLDKHPNVSAVLMDVMMPEMDGYEAMRRLREQPRLSSLPVIALTAKAMKGERERCIAAGASDYLTKPVTNERLLETLGKWLQVGKAANA